MAPNKPNFGERTGWAQGPLYKQTQFAAERIPHHFTVLSFQYSNPTAIVPNKPNFGKLVGWAQGAAVQTKPIPGDGGAGPGVESIVRNKANFPLGLPEPGG
jgi:hypothetical protein